MSDSGRRGLYSGCGKQQEKQLPIKTSFFFIQQSTSSLLGSKKMQRPPLTMTFVVAPAQPPPPPILMCKLATNRYLLPTPKNTNLTNSFNDKTQATSTFVQPLLSSLSVTHTTQIVGMRWVTSIPSSCPTFFPVPPSFPVSSKSVAMSDVLKHDKVNDVNMMDLAQHVDAVYPLLKELYKTVSIKWLLTAGETSKLSESEALAHRWTSLRIVRRPGSALSGPVNPQDIFIVAADVFPLLHSRKSNLARIVLPIPLEHRRVVRVPRVLEAGGHGKETGTTHRATVLSLFGLLELLRLVRTPANLKEHISEWILGCLANICLTTPNKLVTTVNATLAVNKAIAAAAAAAVAATSAPTTTTTTTTKPVTFPTLTPHPLLLVKPM